MALQEELMEQAKRLKVLSAEQLERILNLAPTLNEEQLQELKSTLDQLEAAYVKELKGKIDNLQQVETLYTEYKSDKARESLKAEEAGSHEADEAAADQLLNDL